MYSLWTRWRGAAQTHETSGRIDSPHEALPLPDPERHDAASSSLPILLVDRPIVADIASLMDTYSNRSHDENLTQGLRPPRRAKAANLDPPVLDTMRNQMSPSPVNVPQQRGLHLQAGPSTSSVTRSEELSSSSSRRHLSRLSRQLASVSPWSTFGKRNDTELIHAATGQSVPPSAWHTGSFDSLVPRRSSSSKRKYAQSKQGSLTSLHRFASPSRASSDVLPSKSILSSSTRSSSSKIDEPNDHHEHDASQLHISSSNPSRPQLTRSSHSTQSHSAGGSFQTQSLIFGSPHTFGNPTPTSTRPRSLFHLSEFASPPPPLPPLEHPELLSSLASRSQTHVTNDELKIEHSSAKYPKWIPSWYAQTYPRRRRRKTAGNTGNTSDAISALEPSLRRYSSLPVGRSHLKSRSSSRDTSLLREPFRDRSNSNRRASAEWNAQQATAGVTSLLPSDFGWPAEVAHHLVKLTLGEDVGDADRISGGRSQDAEPRVTQAASQSEPSCPCYPSCSIPVQSDPPSSSTAEQGMPRHVLQELVKLKL